MNNNTTNNIFAGFGLLFLLLAFLPPYELSTFAILILAGLSFSLIKPGAREWSWIFYGANALHSCVAWLHTWTEFFRARAAFRSIGNAKFKNPRHGKSRFEKLSITANDVGFWLHISTPTYQAAVYLGSPRAESIREALKYHAELSEGG